MKITALQVEGYGVWTDLSLPPLAAGLNVFYGPNEAGKTTLLQFIRSILYGFSTERRRYLPPLLGGRPGGRLELSGSSGRFQIARYAGEKPGDDEILVLDGQGHQQGEHVLKVLLSDIDEAIYNNVFAVGLGELQELATLSGTEAASLLYNLSTGMDRVSLVEVMRELRISRSRLLDTAGGPCQINQLVKDRDKLRAEVAELESVSRRYARLAEERDQTDREAAHLQEETGQLTRQVRVLEIALSLRERFLHRKAIVDQLTALGPIDKIPEGAVERLDSLHAVLERRHKSLGLLKEQFGLVRMEAGELKVNDSLRRLGPRIEAMAEQENWIGTLKARVKELSTEIAEFKEQLQAHQERFGLGEDDLPSLSRRSLGALRRPAKTLVQTHRRLKQVQEELATGRQTAQSLHEQVTTALASRGERQLADAAQRLGSLVSQLRRRVQLDQRLEKMVRHQAEVERQAGQLLSQEILSLPVVFGLGAVFIVGAMLILLKLAGFFLPASLVGTFGWGMAILGMLGTGAAAAAKFVLERSRVLKTDQCQQQLRMLDLQVKQLGEERDSLDGQLPRGPGTPQDRLRAAEQELASLEELMPVDAQRQVAHHEAEAVAQRAEDAKNAYVAAVRRWREAVAAAGLPKKFLPKQIRQLAACCEQVAELQDRLARRRQELEERRNEIESVTARVAQLAVETHLGAEFEDPVEQLHCLMEHLKQQETTLKRRQELRIQLRQLRRKRAKHQKVLGRIKHRRRRLLEEVGAADEHEFRRRAALCERAEGLRREQEALDREVQAALAGFCTEEEVVVQLQADPVELDARRTQLDERLKSCETQLKQRFEKRGQLGEQLKTLAEDRTPAAKQLELAMVEARLREAIHRWKVLAVTHFGLEEVRKVYEQTRQPETLCEASGYLKEFTQGRYPRVWTPLGEDILLVDDAQGKQVTVDALSRGAREQLFLCLRLALASSYARRGASLPLVLDDVLVNFDTHRAKAAAKVLHEFAQAGHQLLVFTCHEHIMQMFQAMKVDVCRLPAKGESMTSASESAAEETPREPKKSAKRASRRKTRIEEPVVEAAAPEPAVPPLPLQPPWEESDEEDVEIEPARPASFDDNESSEEDEALEKEQESELDESEDEEISSLDEEGLDEEELDEEVLDDEGFPEEDSDDASDAA